MKSARITALLALTAMSAMLLASCAQNAKPVRFSDSWPDKVNSYESTANSWTRRGLLRASFADQGSQLVELYATFLSTEWRAAYVERQAKLRKLSANSRKSLEANQQKIAAEGYVVELLVTTYHPSHNDLHRDGSIWRLALVDGEGNETLAAKIEKDRRPRELIAAEFKHFGDFAEAYRVTFPHSPQLLHGKVFALRMGSALGSVEVNWKSN
jgi:hypothetical protein